MPNKFLCPVCGYSKWSSDTISTSILGLPKGHEIFICASCQLRRLVPQLNTEELNSLYADAYFNRSETTSLNYLGIEGAPEDYISDVVKERYQHFIRTVERLIFLNPEGKTLLDVGAATGDFLAIAKNKGLNVHGIEFSEYARTKAKEEYGIELLNLPLSRYKTDFKFDFIHLSHVFEHFNDPVTELRHMFRLLDKKGMLYIEIPYQFYFVERLIFKMRRNTGRFTLHSLHHPFFYTPKTITQLLKSQGFQIISVSVFEPERYEARMISQKIKKIIWYLLSLFSVGNYIIIYARKRV
jgi:2-polyprenyl-3-methyl-5-hydroxy-6-metoxy-1,4-benzoquinol methylase